MAIKFTDTEINKHTMILRDKIKKSKKNYMAVYAIPMGGYPVAIMLSQFLNVPVIFTLTEKCIPKEKILIVDDLIDSGKTLSVFKDYDKAVLIVKNDKEDEITYYGKKVWKKDWIVFPWESEHEIENHVSNILRYIGEDIQREGLVETPKRMINSWKELFKGYKQNVEEIIKVFEDGKCDEMVILRNIEFHSTCEHHFLPFFGKISIGYIPNGRVVGVSKLARVVEIYSRRLQVQERLVTQIADILMETLSPKGVMVIAEAQHLCMTSRGIQKQTSVMVTSAIRGDFKKNETRQEFINLIKQGGNQ